jgi:Ni/Co efflux regulator RcnB
MGCGINSIPEKMRRPIMRLLLLTIAATSLIAVPSAFAHGKTPHHARAHAHSRHALHASNRSHQGNRATDRTDATDLASKSERNYSRHPDEEELEVDELAQKAN